MLDHAQTYHRNLSNEAGPHAVEKWKKDVEEAEKRRSQDITAMDVYAAKLSTSPLPGRVAAARPDGPTGTNGPNGTKKWMELALTVEERQ